MPNNFPEPPDGHWRFKQENGVWLFLILGIHYDELEPIWIPIVEIISQAFAGIKYGKEIYKILYDDLCNSAATEWARKADRAKKEAQKVPLQDSKFYNGHAWDRSREKWLAYEAEENDARFKSEQWRDFLLDIK